jgi:hypothetical protein
LTPTCVQVLWPLCALAHSACMRACTRPPIHTHQYRSVEGKDKLFRALFYSFKLLRAATQRHMLPVQVRCLPAHLCVCVCVCVHAHIHIHTRAQAHTCVNMYMDIGNRTHTHTHTHTHTVVGNRNLGLTPRVSRLPRNRDFSGGCVSVSAWCLRVCVYVCVPTCISLSRARAPVLSLCTDRMV